jgi:glyoxylase-like metal-dependent hydrolase (beta-lactamase superfamily II)
MTTPLPPQLRVFVRDWLSSNNILLKSAAGHVLIDTGYVRHAPLMLALLASRQGLDGDGLARVVNTHCHSDHMGGNAAVARAYACPIAVPVGEAPLIERWDTKALWIDYAGQTAERFAVDDVLVPGAAYVWGDLEWRALAAPGHDMGAVVFHNAEHRILVSGDALWENGYGLIMPPGVDPAALPATRATLDMLAKLDVAVVIPGHGEPFTDVAAALDRAYGRTAAFEADEMRMVRHALKVLLTFTLLDRQRMPLDELPAFVDRVPIFRDFNARYLQLAPAALAQRLVDELERAGAARRDGGALVPR